MRRHVKASRPTKKVTHESAPARKRAPKIPLFSSFSLHLPQKWKEVPRESLFFFLLTFFSKDSWSWPRLREFGEASPGFAYRNQPRLLNRQGFFLSAAQPTDQGEESVVFLLLVIVGGDTIFQSPMYSFLGCEKAKTLSQKGCEKAKTLSKNTISTPQISESIPFFFAFSCLLATSR